MYIWLFIVPIAAKTFSLMGDIATVTVFDYQFKIELTLPFSWNVFYFSALFFAIAHLTYNFRCPKLVKQHPTYTSFNREGKPTWHLRGYAEDIGLDYDEFVHDFTEQREWSGDDPIHGEEFKQAIFWHLIWHAQRCRKFALSFCLLNYALGFLLIGIVVAQNFWWVVTSLMTKST
jgi:hypothetical protein